MGAIMDTLWFGFLSCICACFLHFVWWKITASRRPPGPYPWPKMALVAADLAKRYGNVVEVWLNGERHWIITGAALKKLLKSNVMWLRWGDEEGLKEVGMYHEGLVMNNDLEDWHATRRMFRVSVNNATFIQKVKAVSREAVDSLVNHIHKLAKVQGKGAGVELPVGEYMSRLAFDTTGNVSFGTKFDTVSGAVDKEGLVTQVKKFFLAWAFFLLVPPVVRKLQKSLADAHRQVYRNVVEIQAKLIKKRRADHEQGAPIQGDFLDAVLMARDDENPNRRLNDRQIGASVREMILGGTDTTSNSMAMILWHLGAHMDVQERMYRELKEAMVEAGPDATPADVFAAGKCPYGRAVIKEVSRTQMTVPLIFRRPTEDYEIEGYLCPKGTNLINNIGGTASSIGSEFNPDRWLTGDKSLNDLFFPFGAGGRGCIGQHVANYEMDIFVPTLLNDFKITTKTPLVVKWEVVNQVKDDTTVVFTPRVS